MGSNSRVHQTRRRSSRPLEAVVAEATKEEGDREHSLLLQAYYGHEMEEPSDEIVLGDLAQEIDRLTNGESSNVSLVAEFAAGGHRTQAINERHEKPAPTKTK